jgi:hypothetical protein
VCHMSVFMGESNRRRPKGGSGRSSRNARCRRGKVSNHRAMVGGGGVGCGANVRVAATGDAQEEPVIDALHPEHPLISHNKRPNAGDRVVGADIGQTEGCEARGIPGLPREAQGGEHVGGGRNTVENMYGYRLCARVCGRIGSEGHRARRPSRHTALQIIRTSAASCPVHSLARCAGGCGYNHRPTSSGHHKVIRSRSFRYSARNSQIGYSALQDAGASGNIGCSGRPFHRSAFAPVRQALCVLLDCGRKFVGQRTSAFMRSRAADATIHALSGILLPFWPVRSLSRQHSCSYGRIRAYSDCAIRKSLCVHARPLISMTGVQTARCSQTQHRLIAKQLLKLHDLLKRRRPSNDGILLISLQSGLHNSHGTLELHVTLPKYSRLADLPDHF